MRTLAVIVLAAIFSTPQSVVEKFCAAYVKQKEYGLLEGRDRRIIAPMLTKRLLRQLDDLTACQQDWVKQQPQNTTDKPPFVDCCLFTSMPDGMPTTYNIGLAQKLGEGRYRVAIGWEREEKRHETLQWTDALIVQEQPNGEYRIDDVVWHLDENPFNLSTGFKNCREGHWVE